MHDDICFTFFQSRDLFQHYLVIFWLLGLPNAFGQYDESPSAMAECMKVSSIFFSIAGLHMLHYISCIGFYCQ